MGQGIQRLYFGCTRFCLCDGGGDIRPCRRGWGWGPANDDRRAPNRLRDMDSINRAVFDAGVQAGVSPEGEGTFQLAVYRFVGVRGHHSEGIVLDRPGVTFR